VTDSDPAPIFKLTSARAHLDKLQRPAGTVVLTNGCFDLIHHGHVAFLRACAALGDVLVVGLNEDDAVTSLKGKGHPVLSTNQRGQILAGMRWVDLVVTFSQLTAERLIEAVQPNDYAKGAEYDPESGGESLPELEAVTKIGCKLHFVKLTPGGSSSDMYRRASAAAPREPTD
jgi:D-beta-D-heptose 7-phosphate kinase/D-beta-D-heptose 1-phosphate adenosyltransferase